MKQREGGRGEREEKGGVRKLSKFFTSLFLFSPHTKNSGINRFRSQSYSHNGQQKEKKKGKKNMNTKRAQASFVVASLLGCCFTLKRDAYCSRYPRLRPNSYSPNSTHYFTFAFCFSLLHSKCEISFNVVQQLQFFLYFVFFYSFLN